MLKVNFENLEKLDLEKYQGQLEEIKKMGKPDFECHIPDSEDIKSKTEEYKKYKNIILIANGGSRNNTLAFYNSLSDFRNKVNFEFISSDEPFLINNARKKYAPEDTLVIVVSKSGDNINNIEPLLFFLDYPILAITGENNATLSQMADALNWGKIIHPNVSGRFSAMTTCSFAPVNLMGVDVSEIYEGTKEAYQNYSSNQEIDKNDALKLSIHLLELENQGYDEVFTSIYSTPLFGFFPIIVQLMHESAGKEGKGQTFFGDYSPESQHHTNQRLFGGKRNAVALFINEEKTDKDITMEVPENLKNISFRGETLGMLNGIKGSQSMHFDQKGVLGHCVEKKIPAVEISVGIIDPKTIGEFMSFWQYVAYYSAVLRGVDAFNQPEVERAKEISFELRKKK